MIKPTQVEEPPPYTRPIYVQNNPLPRGTFVVGNGLYARCRVCGKIVRLNKPILGDLHVCE